MAARSPAYDRGYGGGPGGRPSQAPAGHRGEFGDGRSGMGASRGGGGGTAGFGGGNSSPAGTERAHGDGAPETKDSNDTPLPFAAIPIQLKLGGVELEMKGGKWAPLSALPEGHQAGADPEEIRRLERAVSNAKDDYERAIEENNLLAFKNKLLTQMLAMAQLDLERRDEELERERLRVEALKWELTKKTSFAASSDM